MPIRSSTARSSFYDPATVTIAITPAEEPTPSCVRTDCDPADGQVGGREPDQEDEQDEKALTSSALLFTGSGARNGSRGRRVGPPKRVIGVIR